MKIQSITLYERGMNEILDGIIEDDDVVFIVQGSIGRKPIIARTKEDAEKQYRAKPDRALAYSHTAAEDRAYANS